MIKEEIPYEVEHQIVGIIYGRVCELIADLNLVNINQTFGGWQQAHETFFKDGGIFDQIYIKDKS